MLDFECVLNTGLNTKDLLLSLEIETWYRSSPSIYSEVYQMPDGSGRLFFVYEMKSSRLLQLIRDYCDKYDVPREAGVEAIFMQSNFVKEYQNVNPAQLAYIPKDAMPVIYKVINEGLPKEVHYPTGLDGHVYHLKTYGTVKQEYQSWVAIPKEWELFSVLVETLISIGCWNDIYDCAFGKKTCKYAVRLS